jgi:hypothetical protein
LAFGEKYRDVMYTLHSQYMVLHMQLDKFMGTRRRVGINHFLPRLGGQNRSSSRDCNAVYRRVENGMCSIKASGGGGGLQVSFAFSGTPVLSSNLRSKMIFNSLVPNQPQASTKIVVSDLETY